MPSGKFDKPEIVDNQDGTISIKYDPRETGLHELHVKFNQEHIPGNFIVIIFLNIYLIFRVVSCNF